MKNEALGRHTLKHSTKSDHQSDSVQADIRHHEQFQFSFQDLAWCNI